MFVIVTTKNKKNESNINRFTCFKSIYIEFINIYNKVSLYILSVVEVQLEKFGIRIFYIKLYNACNEKEIQERICNELLWIKINNN